MLKPPTPIRLPLLAIAALAAVALVSSGCGTSTANEERGRTLFVEKCGACHVMAQAGTTGQSGPDLDHAFAAARESGQTSDTIKGVVAAQVEYPRPDEENPAAMMPAMIVTGQDLNDVAAYVGRYAGVPDAAPPRVEGGPGAQVFADQGCGGCHKLAAAGAGGVTGPDLDEVLPGQSMALIHEAIVEPEARTTPGYPPNLMPSNYEDVLTDEQLDDLVRYLMQSTSGNGGG